MLAFELALEEDGAEGLELDLQRSADGEVVVLHDETLDRTTNTQGLAREFSLARLRELDAGFGFVDAGGERPFSAQGIRIPTLDEVLAAFPGVWMSLDLKGGDPVTEARTLELIDAHGAHDHVVVSAEDPTTARRLRDTAPELRRFFDRAAAREFYLRHRLRLWWGYSAPAHSLQIPLRAGRWRLDSRRLVEDAHRRAIAVRYWTINDAPTMDHLIDLGVDGIITDVPALLRERLVLKGLR